MKLFARRRQLKTGSATDEQRHAQILLELGDLSGNGWLGPIEAVRVVRYAQILSDGAKAPQVRQ
jgi:hypothetical protein